MNLGSVQCIGMGRTRSVKLSPAVSTSTPSRQAIHGYSQSVDTEGTLQLFEADLCGEHSVLDIFPIFYEFCVGVP